jgi:hypothetical protein
VVYLSVGGRAATTFTILSPIILYVSCVPSPPDVVRPADKEYRNMILISRTCLFSQLHQHFSTPFAQATMAIFSSGMPLLISSSLSKNTPTTRLCVLHASTSTSYHGVTSSLTKRLAYPAALGLAQSSLHVWPATGIFSDTVLSGVPFPPGLSVLPSFWSATLRQCLCMCRSPSLTGGCRRLTSELRSPSHKSSCARLWMWIARLG